MISKISETVLMRFLEAVEERAKDQDRKNYVANDIALIDMIGKPGDEMSSGSNLCSEVARIRSCEEITIIHKMKARSQ